MNPARRAWLVAALAAAAQRGWAAARSPIELPRDFGAHPQTRIEWWYVTGALEVLAGAPAPAAAGPAFGFQLTFFRIRTGLAEGHPSRFAAQQLLFAHAAVTDLAERRLRHDERIARMGFGIAEASTLDTDLRLRGWRLERSRPVAATAQASARAAADARDGTHDYRAQITSPGQGFGLDLRLTATQPVLLQGQAGWSRKGPDAAQASHYLSEPQLATTGTLAIDGRRLAVRGQAWLDHEWSDSLLHPEAVGWDWIGMNLDDGGALTAFRLRRADGSALWAGGSHRPAGGGVRNFGPQEVVFTPLRHWLSPATQARYPVDWRVETPAGRFEVHALLDAQELDSRGLTGTAYWEGLSELHEASTTDRGAARVVGRGYLEMTGYAGRLAL